MKNLSLLSLLAALTGCGSATEPNGDGIPAECHAYTARQYHFGEVTCAPESASTCAFGVHNQLVKFDQSGEPLAYYCTCDAGGTYACWGAPGLAKADPLPAE